MLLRAPPQHNLSIAKATDRIADVLIDTVAVHFGMTVVQVSGVHGEAGVLGGRHEVRGETEIVVATGVATSVVACRHSRKTRRIIGAGGAANRQVVSLLLQPVVEANALVILLLSLPH